MNREQAQFLLQSYRPHHEDREDPAFAEALAWVERDESLRDWHDREMAFDQMFQNALQEIAPPASLKDEILAGMKASGGQGADFVPPAPSPLIPFRRASLWIAGMAAVLVVGLGLSMFFASSGQSPRAGEPGQEVPVVAMPRTAPALIQFLSRHLEQLRVEQFETVSPDFDTLRAHLVSRQAPVPDRAFLPVDLAQAETIGCLQLAFEGEPMSMICFRRDGRVYHLFSMAEGSLPPALLQAEYPGFFTDAAYAFSLWEHAGQIHVLASEGEDAARRIQDFF